MSNYGTLLFNKIIEQDDVAALKRHGLDKTHFVSDTDRKTFDFIEDYAAKNGGHAPSLEVVMTEIDSFIATRGVEDSYEYLTRKILNETAAHEFAPLYDQIPELFSDGQKDMSELLDNLTDKLQSIKIRTSVRDKVGHSLKLDTKETLAEYDKRKNGETSNRWSSGFDVIGDLVSGNMYVVMAESGRGKSATMQRVCVTLAKQGATVLDWSMEMTTYERLVRYYSYLSADDELNTYLLSQGRKVIGGFDTRKLREGTLSPEQEAQFTAYVTDLINALPGDIIIRGVDDGDFDKRDLRALEADILASKADVVLVDPFYYLDYEKNTSKTAGGDAAETSKKLRRMTGRLKVVTIAITQAEETETVRGDEERELSLPKRADVKKTKALLEDANMLIAVDTNYHQEIGIIGINKGRDGGEGTAEEIMYIPQYGIIKPLNEGIDVNQFGF